MNLTKKNITNKIKNMGLQTFHKKIFNSILFLVIFSKNKS